MSFEFACTKCDAFTIFKDLEVDPPDICCANCEKRFHLEKDLVRFDRTDKDKVGRLMPSDEAQATRIKILMEKVLDLTERAERIESLLLDSASAEDIDIDFGQKN